jgi:hypothetical protein
MIAIAAALVLALLVIYGLAVWQMVRAPFRALGVLVAGMAVHNFLIMILLRLGTPSFLVRIVQAWKEGIILLLLGLAGLALLRAWHSRALPTVSLSLEPRAGAVVLLDLVVVAFAALAVLYTVLPQSLLHGSANLTQRFIGLRVVLLLPALYLFGRVFQPRSRDDLRWVGFVILGASAFVGLFGLYELWLVPTRDWLSWGVNQFSAWLGFRYNGPFGLPANFFQTTLEGPLLRRMVSTYISPLGIAYAGLVVTPLAIALVVGVRGRARWFAVLLTVLLLAGIMFSLTRLALFMVVIELFIIAVLTRNRWLLYAIPVVALAAVFMLFQYPYIGPLMDRQLNPIAQRPSSLHIASSGDPSLGEHASLLGYDLRYVRQHPLGTGIGSSIHRFGTSAGTGESAIFDMFGDMGVLGGLLYLLMYAGSFFVAVFAYFRLRRDLLLAMLPLVAAVAGAGLGPVTITSDLWSDFATTFLFWWAAGASVTLLASRDTTVLDAPAHVAAESA